MKIKIFRYYEPLSLFLHVYQLSPKTRKSNVFSKNVRFCYWCWNSSACWIWCENLFRHAFLGFLWRSEGGNGSTWDACRVFWHLFLVCLLRNLPSIASCNQPFLFGTVLVFLWGLFFRTCFFCNDGGTPTTLATQFLNGAGAVAGAGIIQLENVFFSKCEDAGCLQDYFCRCLGEIAHGNWSH